MFLSEASHRPSFLPFLLALTFSYYAGAQTITARAIVPTASGQIGVNPVDETLGAGSNYVAPIGVDTWMLTPEGSTTKWIGVNTEYLTETVVTETITGRPVISTTKAQIIASTASAAAEGIAAGDVTLLLSEKLKASLSDAVSAAGKACAAAKIRRRAAEDFTACMIDWGRTAASGGEGSAFFDAAANQAWENFILDVSTKAPLALSQAFAVLKSQGQKNMLAAFVAFFAILGTTAINYDNPPPAPNKLKFPEGKVGGTATASEPTKTTTTSTSSACDPKKTPDENDPVCDDEDCQGKDKLCTTEQKKNCRCTEWADVTEDTYDTAFGDEQQKLLKEAFDNLPAAAAPSCFRNTNGDTFDGKPKADPSAWCVCTSGTSHGIYATMTDTKSPCAYGTMPTKTISITNKPGATDASVTSCRWVTDTAITVTSHQQYCTCNDDKMHGDMSTRTLTSAGKTITTCEPKAAATPTPSIVLMPNNAPRCMGDPTKDVTFSRSELEKTVTKSCNSLISDKKVFDSTSNAGWSMQFFSGYTLKDPDSKTSKDGYRITVNIGVNQRACREGQVYKIDFVAMGLKTCVDHFMVIADKCIQGDKIAGGINYVDCADWTIGTGN